MSKQFTVTDPLGNPTHFVYDDADRLIERIDPRGGSAFFAYDAVGNLTQTTDRIGRIVNYTYDDLDRRIGETWLDTGGSTVNTVSMTYDAIGNLLAASDAYSSYTFTYDGLNRLATSDNAGTPGLPNVVLTYGR